MSAVTNTVTSGLALYVTLADTNDIIFNGSNTSERISNKVFRHNFSSYIDLKFSDLDEH